MVKPMADIEALLPLIEKISKQVSADYPDIDWQDVRGEICLFVLSTKSLKSKDEGGNPGWILRRVGTNFCKKERVQQLYLSPQYSYRPSDVVKILETAWSSNTLDKTYVPEDAASLAGVSDPLDLASDIREAYDTLSGDLKKSIFMRYALGEIPEKNSYARKRLNQAVKELTQRLNGYRGKHIPVRRKAISNAESNAIISQTY